MSAQLSAELEGEGGEEGESRSASIAPLVVQVQSLTVSFLTTVIIG